MAGAGPAGSAAAGLLARGGHDVLVLEKEHFPRFRIGESLLPACMGVLDRLGVTPHADTYVYKNGAEFVCEDSGRAHSFAFAEALPGCPADHAWHVDRARFDAELLELAVEAGAEARHGETVQSVAFDADGVQVTSTSGVERARFFLDATGQTRLLARRNQSVEHFDEFGLSAAFTHYEDLGDAYEEVFGEKNDIRIMIRKDGWGWIIPLPHRRLSVGIVSRDKATEEVLEKGLLSGPLMTRLSRGARRTETRIAGNYSYANRSAYGARYATAGDATSFLDPVFSSGVTLALRGAEGVADALLDGFARGSEADPDLMVDHARSMESAYQAFAALIRRFYHTSFAESFFLRGLPDYELRRGVMSVLAGDVWRDDNPFQQMLLRGRSQRTAVRG